MNKDLRTQFYRVYANLPLGLRKNIIALYADKPVTWDVIYIEVQEKTKASKVLLEYLRRLEII